jgi:hypothetical protein
METAAFDVANLHSLSRKELVSLAKSTGACPANMKSDEIMKVDLGWLG